MITFSRFGDYGRLGNQFFQYAAMLGISIENKVNFVLPHWEYAEYFEAEFPAGTISEYTPVTQNIQEKEFHYTPEAYTNEALNYRNNVTDFLGYFQSEKYWQAHAGVIKSQLKFKKEFTEQQRRKFYKAFQNKTIAISIRRGDYVDNPNYELLPINYYITALYEHFPAWRSHNIIIFSDDIPYCKVHFDCIPNVYFSENNTAIEDICLMSMCDDFILSNSTFSFWGAYLGEKKRGKVIRPSVYFKGALGEANDTKDFWPERWLEHKHQGKKIDLTDVTFTIPVMYDHKDRKKNLDLTVCMLQHYFNTNIIVGEMEGQSFRYMAEYCRYINFPELKHFHRTKMLNVMAEFSETPYIANWDADICIAPLQLLNTVERLRNGADMVYPYGWAFARIPRVPWFPKLEKYMDIGVVGDTKFNGMNNNDAVSVGGAVFFNKASFFEGGGENENFVSFGPEDAERYHRFQALGYTIERVPGALYHINHYVSTNSSNKHAHVNSNRAEWASIQDMSKKELKAYVKTWRWLKETT